MGARALQTNPNSSRDDAAYLSQPDASPFVHKPACASASPEAIASELYLTDERWALIASRLPGKEGDPGCHGRDNRLFMEAVFWIVRHDATWRSLPPEFGKWYTIYTRFRRWTLHGVWPVVLHALAADDSCEFFYEQGEIRHEPRRWRPAEESAGGAPERVA
ncbi:MAG TPA: transposase [Methylocystis sp.]|nr:transposase [Methylocystis sp.]